MPVYTFVCEQCSLKFEKVLKVNYTEAVLCPSCNYSTNKLPPQKVMGKVGEVKSLPKEIDLKVGADADKRWEEYEYRKSEKERIRKETNSDWISRDLDGGYSPLTVMKDNEVVSGKEAVQIRQDLWNATKNPEIEKTGEDY